MRGIVRTVVVDTTHAGGDRPESCSVEAIDLPGAPNIVELVRHRWTTVVPRVALGDGSNRFDVPACPPFTHVRLVIYPDGAVARLRCLGEPAAPGGVLGEVADLAAVSSGGRVVDCSHPGSSPANRMLGAPGPPPEGWLTPRRRTPGHEWAVVRLAGSGTLDRLEVDTTGFEGESPGAIAVLGVLAPDDGAESLRTATWRPVLGQTPVREGTHQVFRDLLDPGPFSHLRVDLHPDGGVQRFSAFGPADAPWT